MMTTHNQSYEVDYERLKKLLATARTDSELFQAIVNVPFTDKLQASLLSLGIVVLLLVNKQHGTIDRIALSDTQMAEGAVQVSVKPFNEIRIPLDYTENVLAEVIHTGQPQKVSDWRRMFIPELTAEQARLNQASAGIGCSVIYPLVGARDGGALIFSYYNLPEAILEPQQEFMENYSQIVAERLNAPHLA